MKLQIEPVDPETDTLPIAALENRLFGSDAWSVELVADELRAAHRSYWKLVAADEILGYAGALILGSEADVQTIGIVPEIRGHGWGRKLLQHLGAQAQKQGAKTMFLEVRADNPAAINLYLSSGFTELGIRPKYYQPDGIDAVIMRAKLPLKHTAKQEKNTDD